MGSRTNQYQTLSDGNEWSVNRDIEDSARPLSSEPTIRSPWNWRPQDSRISNISQSGYNNYNVRSNVSKGVTLCPERLLASGLTTGVDNTFQRSTVSMPSKLPQSLWTLLSYGLGISPNTKAPSTSQLCVATALHVITVASALSFGACGLIFNIYDTISEFTRTTALVCVAKSVLGLCWILLGTYSHSLAARLFSGRCLLDYIRLHSKTFMKISTVLWISIMSLAVIGTNFYTNVYLLGDDYDHNDTNQRDATCNSVGLSVIICQIYFGSKVIFSLLNLVWNLVVVAVCLSVCRTHTVCIRRFTRELSFDSKIYEEFYKLKMFPGGSNHGVLQNQFSEYEFVDVFCTDNSDDDVGLVPTNGENVLNNLRIMRQKKLSQSCSGDPSVKCSNANKEMERRSNADTQDDDYSAPDTVDAGSVSEAGVDDTQEDVFIDVSRTKPPIMNNEDILLTYYRLTRHLRSTSRLLSRWLSGWLTFILIWCNMLIIYWASHSAKLSGIFQFLLPVIVMGLLTSAYAEVNFEGQVLLKAIFPTEDRMSVLFYVNNTPLELKVYSLAVTYNVLVTVIAGVGVTFATRIILDSVL